VKLRTLVSSFIVAAVCMGAVSARPQQLAMPPQQPKLSLRLTPAEIELYKRAPTVINWSPEQIHYCPFLHKLRPADSPAQLPIVLDRVGQTATLLFHDFTQVSCDEEVISESTLRDPRATLGSPRNLRWQRKFRYIVIPRQGGDFPALDEYRTDLKGNPLDDASLNDLFLITSKFASTWLYLSPANQPGSSFRYFGTQTIRHRECHVVAFAQNPERVHIVGVFQNQGKSVALLVQGLAWIDSETFQVLRIMTWLLAPRMDVSLRGLGSIVDFHPVQPSGTERVLWLPCDVTVQAVYRGVGVRNTHHYSNFKLFRVESTIKPEE
jgi:hypothetical protein